MEPVLAIDVSPTLSASLSEAQVQTYFMGALNSFDPSLKEHQDVSRTLRQLDWNPEENRSGTFYSRFRISQDLEISVRIQRTGESEFSITMSTPEEMQPVLQHDTDNPESVVVRNYTQSKKDQS